MSVLRADPRPTRPEVLSPPVVTTIPGTDPPGHERAGGPDATPDSPTQAAQEPDREDAIAWSEPPLPNGAARTYLTSGGSAIVAVAFLVFVVILLGYFTSATSWAPW
jgi:hypothetical protein